jgi:hypothetical protein
MGADEKGRLSALKAIRRESVDPRIVGSGRHCGRREAVVISGAYNN